MSNPIVFNGVQKFIVAGYNMNEPKSKCPVCGVDDIIYLGGKHYYICGYRRSPDGDSECGSFIKGPTAPTKCTCDIKELFWGGCKCGWLAIEKKK